MLRNPNDLTVRGDFDILLHSLSPDELEMLEAGIVQDGLTDPIILWNNVIVDGHNRHRIALKLGLREVPTKDKEFTDENQAKAWILSNQLGRRNLFPHLASIYRGRLIELLRPDIGTTEAVRQVASEQQKSERTVYRDLEIVEGLETNEALRTQYLGGNLSATALLAELKRDVVVPKVTTKEDREREAQRVFPKTARIVLDRVITGCDTLEGLCRDVGIVFKNRGLELARFSELLASPDLSKIREEAERLKEVEYEER